MKKKVIFICTQDTLHAGKKYLKGQAMDPEDPIPQGGSPWSIYQGPEEQAPSQQDLAGAVTSASRGQVWWKSQPGRPRAPDPTPQQMEAERTDPYGLQRAAKEAGAAPAPAPEKEKPVVPYQKRTQEEIDDPYGLRAKAAAQTRELLKGKEEK